MLNCNEEHNQNQRNQKVLICYSLINDDMYLFKHEYYRFVTVDFFSILFLYGNKH